MDHRSTEGLSPRQTVEQRSHLGGPSEDPGTQLALGVLRVHNSADGMLGGGDIPTQDVQDLRYGIPNHHDGRWRGDMRGVG